VRDGTPPADRACYRWHRLQKFGPGSENGGAGSFSSSALIRTTTGCETASSRSRGAIFKRRGVRRGASAAERRGSALWRNVLSVVWKSRNSSAGLYRCRRRSAHDRRRTNAVRFFTNTLFAYPRSSLIHAFPAKPSLGTLGSRRCLRVPARPLSRVPRLPAWHNYSSQSFGASSILLFKAAGTL
jgi:hypothetical protein